MAWWWPFVSRRKYRELQLIAIDRGHRLIEANDLCARQAVELHNHKMLLAGRSHTIRKIMTPAVED